MTRKEIQKILSEYDYDSVSPELQVIVALENSSNNYSILKFGKMFTPEESEIFIYDTISDIKEAGKYEILIEKTKEMQEAFRSKYEEITTHQLDDFVNEWLEWLILPKHYSKEEDRMRFEAVRNWYWSSYFMEDCIVGEYRRTQKHTPGFYDPFEDMTELIDLLKNSVK
ncbi:MAG: hypothetical protein D8M58_21330 [Calditrichaeota bacterium]|nr:MAG: hypothetical protein DWQ03_00055 [Calditrichota bacterium]MBL1207956.1 hypothetical protein [Calditrichota bacterium]NOG47793.1 hypothetical protein [Calditrichota bacterium]